MLRMEGDGWNRGALCLYNVLVTMPVFGIDTLESCSNVVTSTNNPTKGDTMTATAYTSAEGTARLVAEVFDELRTGEPVTYVASLSFETHDAIVSVKRHARLTWEEANAQVDFWTRLYNLTTY